MLTVDTIRKVRMSLARGESLREVSRRYHLSRNTVRKIAHSKATEWKYPKRAPRYPVLGPVLERLDVILPTKNGHLFKQVERSAPQNSDRWLMGYPVGWTDCGD